MDRETPDGLSDAERRFKLPAGTFPFQSRFLRVSGATLHYIDEGAGQALFMVHGNPTWSFVYRHLIQALRADFRCIAIDLPGFGMSEPPEGFGYTPAEHAAIVAAALRALDVNDAWLIAHDWGGPIGLAAMFAEPGRLTGICLGNTWAWPVNGDVHFEWFSRLIGGPIGRFFNERNAMFVNWVMPAAMRRRKLTLVEMTAYRAPFDPPRLRAPLHIFPRQITAAQDWLDNLETRLTAYRGPAVLIWPANDIAFRMKELDRWKKLLPQAQSVIIERCGHYLWEDAPQECAARVRAQIEGGPKS